MPNEERFYFVLDLSYVERKYVSQPRSQVRYLAIATTARSRSAPLVTNNFFAMPVSWKIRLSKHKTRLFIEENSRSPIVTSVAEQQRQ
jgi:hypothetical protein